MDKTYPLISPFKDLLRIKKSLIRQDFTELYEQAKPTTKTKYVSMFHKQVLLKSYI